MSSDALPPTTQELKKLIDAAAAGSTAAQTRLEELAKESADNRKRIDALEKKLEEKKPAPAPTPAPAEEPITPEEKEELDLLGGWL